MFVSRGQMIASSSRRISGSVNGIRGAPLLNAIQAAAGLLRHTA
jgi:hypothetical protein